MAVHRSEQVGGEVQALHRPVQISNLHAGMGHVAAEHKEQVVLDKEIEYEFIEGLFEFVVETHD